MAPPSAFRPSLRQVSGLFLERGRGHRVPLSPVSPSPPEGARAVGWGCAGTLLLEGNTEPLVTAS